MWGNEGKDGLSQKQFIDSLGVDPTALTDPSQLFGNLYAGLLDGSGDGSGDGFPDLTGGTSNTGSGGIFGIIDAYSKAQSLAKGKVEPSNLTSPGTAKNAITVGASESYRPKAEGWGGYASNPYQAAGFFGEPIASDEMSDNINGMAAFSSRGPTQDGRTKPDLAAPGTNIISNRSPLGSDKVYWGPYGQTQYAYAGGTSQASPFAAGSAALVREWLQKKQGQATPSAALIKAVMINGAHDMAPGQYGEGPTQEMDARPNSVEGWGRIDLAAALDPKGPQATLVLDEKAGMSTQGDRRYVFHVKSGSPLAVTLAWSDFPGSPTAQKALVNDLDLVVTSPRGDVAAGNGQADRLNNVEGVDLAAPVDGDYIVEVKGANVPSGPQPYAVVVSGSVIRDAPPAGVRGDINGDGRLTAADATLALKATTGSLSLTPDQIKAGDTDGDGKVTLGDVLRILKAAVGLGTL